MVAERRHCTYGVVDVVVEVDVVIIVVAVVYYLTGGFVGFVGLPKMVCMLYNILCLWLSKRLLKDQNSKNPIMVER